MGLSVLSVFFSIINFGYRANQGKVVWRAPKGNQLGQATSWFKKNPFIINVRKQEGFIDVLMSEAIDIKPMTEGNVASVGASVYIIDEAKKIHKGHKIYDEALESYGMFAEGDLEFKRMISASTGARLTLFHDQYESGEWDYSMHTYKDCPWITEEFVEGERRANPNDPYYVLQEYECVWVARGDTAFQNLWVVDMVKKMVTHGSEQYNFGEHPDFPVGWEFPEAENAGCDFNGPTTGQYVVMGSFDHKKIYLNREKVLFDLRDLIWYGDNYALEIEAGPFKINVEAGKECKRLGVKCIHKNWEKAIIAERFYLFTHRMIIIDLRACHFTLMNFQEAVTDPNATEHKLKKSSKQHGLDAAFHMAHKFADSYVASAPRKQQLRDEQRKRERYRDK